MLKSQEIRRRTFLTGATAATAWATAGFNLRKASADDRGASPGLCCLDGDPQSGTSRAVIVADQPLVHTDQVFAESLNSGATRDAAVESVERQLDAVLTSAGSSLGRIVRLHWYVAANDWVPVIQARMAKRYSAGYRPAATFVTGPIADAQAQVAADCVAVADTAPTSSSARPRQVVHRLKSATLPAGEKVYISGDAKPGDFPTAARDTLQSLAETLAFLGLDWSHVVQLKAFVQPADAAHRAILHDIGKLCIPGDFPPLSVVGWRSPSLPIEIELVAVVPEGKGNQTSAAVEYLTPPGAKASPVFSRVARVNADALLYTSGLYGDPSGDSPARVRSVLKQVGHLVERGGGSMRQLVKATYYVGDDAASADLGKIRPEFYDPKSPPAASKAMTQGVGREGHALCVDMIAAARWKEC